MPVTDFSGIFANFALSMFLQKIVVPSDFHDQCAVVNTMLANDVTGLIDSLTDFAVESANVNFSVETTNEVFTKKLNYWLDNINKDYNGLIPRGINAVAKEYFQERWKSSSFPILKILEWKRWEGIVVPSKLCIVDGGSVFSKPKTGSTLKKQLQAYDYYLGEPSSVNAQKNEDDQSEKLDKGCIITKPFCRWFAEYPVPFLIKRGIYENYMIIKSLKQKQTTILDQIIPYLFLITKGTEGMATADNSPKRAYSQPELDTIVNQFQTMMDNMSSTSSSNSDKNIKSPIRATQFDEEIKHIIPDMSVIFKSELFTTTERNILSGLGFIDVIEATSDTRRESILNPKIFVEDVRAGVKDFKTQILAELISKVIERNKGRRKYANSEFHIVNSPVVGFMTDKFKNLVRQLFTYGKISSQTAIEVIAEQDFETEVYRIEQERKRGIPDKMYPPVVQNVEDKPNEVSGKTPEQDEKGDAIPDDKRDPNEKKEYKMSTEEMEVVEGLVGAPYPTIKSLPDAVKKLPITAQRIWRKTWNSAYKYALGKFDNDIKQAETYAFKVAWNVINKNTKENK